MSITLVNEYGDLDEVGSFVFPGGEIQVKVDTDNLTITSQCVARLQSANNIMELLLVKDILDQERATWDGTDSCLIIPYFPYARQDRRMVKGEALSAKVICNLINSLNFSRVTSYDLHSDVVPALLNNFNHVEVQNIVADFDFLSDTLRLRNTVIVSPDVGASKKILKISQKLKKCYPKNDFPVIQASKVRDVNTGEITGTHIDFVSVSKYDNFVIMDDICDGGRTFIELAKVLREAGAKKIYLYVTHGIFSKGLDVFKELIDGIFTTNTFLNDYTSRKVESSVPLFVRNLV